MNDVRITQFIAGGIVSLAALLAVACQQKPGTASDDAGIDAESREFAFGDEFQFGVATSGFQADMGCPTWSNDRCVDERSDWYQFATADVTLSSARAHLSGDTPSAGPGFWELYEADVRRVADDLELGALRHSVEWSRLFPSATDEAETDSALRNVADSSAVAHYDEMFAQMRQRGVEPWVTLIHYTLPVWLHAGAECHVDFTGCERRGWLDRERLLREVEKYAEFVGTRYGDRVDRWITLNEPLAVVIAGYLRPSSNRTNPPAVSLKPDAAKRAWQTMVLAHVRMYDALKRADTTDADGDGRAARVGIAYNFSPVRPADPDLEVHRQAADNIDYLYNHAFVDAITRGTFDENLDGEAEVDAKMAGRLDFVGLNYYGEVEVGGVSESILPDFSPLFTVNPLKVEIQYNRPDGMTDTLIDLHKRYDLPIVVTENGTTAGGATDSDGTDQQSRFLVQHLDAALRAVNRGVDLDGYFFWTLMDNFEWNHGFNLKMGLYRVDFTDPSRPRIPRPVVETYSTIADDRQIPVSLRDSYLTE